MSLKPSKGSSLKSSSSDIVATASAEKTNAPDPPVLPNEDTPGPAALPKNENAPEPEDELNEVDEEPEVKKRGNLGAFKGAYSRFLRKHLPDYAKVTARAEKSTWLTGFAKKWMDKFPWHTGKEPAEFAVLKGKGSSTLSEDECNALLKKRDALQEEVKVPATAQIVNWLRCYVGKVSEISPPAKPKGVDPFLLLLLKLLQQMVKGGPHHTENVKFYMHHEKYRPKVQVEYECQMKENPEAAIGGSMNHLGFRVKIASELWATKEQSV
ncbi:hypothetical protein BT96DRAFT_942230 [Gymnopus androsaceus JB14]|uniref:Uncharacterized protein n=1 Tax=Gymnopus androsaceus JB14 TaxID=1447944 RepID=A0A6A4HBL7_9AGAR|nr:hypothetical protein BT96DRAFT_942230 [Gymnopus androsaceus JB14]